MNLSLSSQLLHNSNNTSDSFPRKQSKEKGSNFLIGYTIMYDHHHIINHPMYTTADPMLILIILLAPTARASAAFHFHFVSLGRNPIYIEFIMYRLYSTTESNTTDVLSLKSRSSCHRDYPRRARFFYYIIPFFFGFFFFFFTPYTVAQYVYGALFLAQFVILPRP